jgi:hypothetical protein
VRSISGREGNAIDDARARAMIKNHFDASGIGVAAGAMGLDVRARSSQKSTT